MEANGGPTTGLCSWWMPASQGFLGPDSLREQPVHLQNLDGRAARGGAAENATGFPLKMVRPSMNARMKDRNSFAGGRVGCLPACAFAQRTRHARQREIIQRSRAACSERMNMIDVESSLLTCLGKPAVFAALPRALKDRSSEAGRYHQAAAAVAFDARSFNSESISAISTRPSASSRSAAVKGVPSSCRSSNSFSLR